jgi:DNA-binding CsgD family transcriptional regulator
MAAQVGGQVVGGGVDEMVEERRADQRAEGALLQLDGALHEVDRRDRVLAVGAHVVADDEGAIRPADQDRPVEPQLVGDGRQVVGPEPAVGVVLGLERRLGHAVAAQIVGHQPELAGERALVLLHPAEMVLRPAVDEQDRRPVLPAPLADVQGQATAAPHRVRLQRHDPLRAARLYDRLGRYLHESGRTDAALSAFQRVVELVPARPPSPERAQALASLATGLMLARRFDESLAVCEQTLALARAVGAPAAELQALLDRGRDLAYLGGADEGLAQLRQALALAEERGDPLALLQAYISLSDVLMMIGRPGASARQAERGLAAVGRYGIDSTVLVANHIEALLATGDWDEADGASAAALRAITANFPYMLLMLRADLELGRGDLEAARAHLDAALATLREDRGQGIYDVFLAELALWERRWTEADRAVRDGLARSRSRQAAQLRVWFSAKGLRALAELAALARARRDADAARRWLDHARRLVGGARRDAEQAAAVTPNAGGCLAVAEAEYERARGAARPESWSGAAAAWERLERPPLAAYCRWREAEALVAAGASRAEASVPLRAAHATAARIGAAPLLRELELLAQRARLDLAPPEAEPDRRRGLEEALGLTAREAEVLALVARGYTNREIAAALVISVKTASVHVSHILRKLGAPNRLEAATIAHRLAPPAES